MFSHVCCLLPVKASERGCLSSINSRAILIIVSLFFCHKITSCCVFLVSLCGLLKGKNVDWELLTVKWRLIRALMIATVTL